MVHSKPKDEINEMRNETWGETRRVPPRNLRNRVAQLSWGWMGRARGLSGLEGRGHVGIGTESG